MSLETDAWIHVGHILGFVLWVGGLLAVAALLRAHEGADAASRPGILGIARSTAILMDVGATLTIALGLVMAFKSPMYPNTAFKTGGWLHVKLALVVVGIIVPHGLIRRRIAALKRDAKPGPLPGWIVPLLLVAAIAVIALGANPFLLRK